MILLENFPNEILINILNFLNLKSLINLSLVNKFFFELTKENKYCDINEENYKLISFINHCKKINHFKDLTLNFKYHIREYPQLLENNLKSLSIKLMDIFDLKIIENNKNLKNLDIYCSINIENQLFINLFDNLNNIKNISINNHNIDDKILEKFNKYKLNSLTLDYCLNIKKLSKIKQNNLIKFSLSHYRELNNQELVNFLKSQGNLKELSLLFCNIDFLLISTLTYKGKNLSYLNISYPLGNLNDLSAYFIAHNCHNLTYLNLSASKITNQGVFFIVKKCKKIKKLNLSGSRIKDYALVHIANYLENIESLDVSFTNITRIGICNLHLKCKNLSYLNIINDKFSIKFLKKFSKALF